MRSAACRCRRSLTVALTTLASLLSVTAWAQEQQVLFDFEAGNLGEAWSPLGKLQAARVDLPAPPPAGKPKPGKPGPEGKALQVKTEAGGALVAKSGLVPADWRKYGEVCFWVHRSAEEVKAHKSSTIEVRAYEADGKARFWRKVELGDQGWTEVRLPLKWLRWGEGRIPRWDQVDRFGFYFRDAAEVTVDTISLAPGTGARSAELVTADLETLAFPLRKPDQTLITEQGPAVVVSDSPDLNAERLAAHLKGVAAAVLADFPFLEKPALPVPLLVFAARDGYDAFPARLAAHQGAEGVAPKSTGFTLHAIATSFYDPKFGSLRPVYTHEYTHALLSRVALLDNRGEWFQEGLASRYQLRFHPQDNLPRIVADGLSDPQKHTPLEQLCSGERVPLDRYWQAMTVIDLLIEKHPAQLSALVSAFHKSGSTDLGPQLKPHLGTDWNGFTDQWKAYCREKFPVAK